KHTKAVSAANHRAALQLLFMVGYQEIRWLRLTALLISSLRQPDLPGFKNLASLKTSNSSRPHSRLFFALQHIKFRQN
ncbi:hypothetical protein QUS67_22625, partial [Xanthomonas citri pv. citri]